MDAQADTRFYWTHVDSCFFSDAVAQMGKLARQVIRSIDGKKKLKGNETNIRISL